MALDGISIHALVHEFNETFLNGKINKISQPEKEELLITINTQNGNKRLLVSANASLPFMYITDENKTAPAQAPGFCMLLRKHIGAGRIIEISQMGMERAVRFKIQHLNEMGDITYKYLYIEIMGKHSNIIFCNEDNMILDSIKHIPSSVSSVREVLPGRDYFIPTQEGKTNPLESSEDSFKNTVLKRSESVFKALMSSYIGISPTIANEICFRAGIDSDASCASLFDEHKEKLWVSFTGLMDDIRNDNYSYNIIIDAANGKPLEYAPVALTMYQDMETKSFKTMSEVLIEFYAKRNQYTNIRQKSADLRKIINNHIERASKKLDLQLKQQKDTEKRDKYKIYGEMLHTYGYEAKPNDKSITVINYYDNKELTIPLDPDLSATENAKKYFDKYAKLKRTAEALNIYIEQSKQELELLQSIEAALNIVENETDLAEIRRELSDHGFIKKHSGNKKEKIKKSKPLHFVDDNGFDIYVGKNNYQNDELTFKFATGNDWWFHTKKIHGSHVIVKTNGKELPDSTYEYAAELAAYYSSGRDSQKVEIDYLQKKNVKKPASAVAGFVVYYTNYSLMATPTLEHVKLISQE
ncbi:MAG: fibronectin/fibrinogen-binding protein [Pseudobutyrivibrio ruminis]|uniref:Rqc2 family fibronectin-binding protein n=1 Tax=Pseudobutyrivibrio ruminis TaxID=46206 RepID=UPI0026F35C2B|nr:NFACT RNA binding domain-containing protein [Pseudobutyrivibrio ruminis]MBE5912466.1 fibronectin/fibrinogen-binding protein [Pseudobutyrivibrio ruminis]